MQFMFSLPLILVPLPLTKVFTPALHQMEAIYNS